LETEEDELDFVLGRFPTRFRVAEPSDDLAVIFARHIKTRKKRGSETETETMVPASYDGFRTGDVIGMILGGSGDNLAFALSKRTEAIHAAVFRIPPFILKNRRAEFGDGRSVDADAETLALLVRDHRDDFYPVTRRDRDLMQLRGALNLRTDAMKARIACEQRLRQRLIGEIFRSEDGLYPEGAIEDLFEEREASDLILSALAKEERARNHELENAAEALPVYRDILSEVVGCGPAISARIIAAVGDIRRFASAAKFKAFCGVHLLDDGRFARRRGGEVANWSPDARQALYLLGDQFLKRPKSEWGGRLIEYKKKFRAKHPPEVVDGKKRYSDMHIQRMAIWRTVTKFAEWLWREWWKLEKQLPAEQESAA
ncbi:MAG: transposase, partial [Candidatus Niyogibacteria bacterium]|nr:transposase [Candidatus Niyogibacteria bacterium]